MAAIVQGAAQAKHLRRGKKPQDTVDVTDLIVYMIAEPTDFAIPPQISFKIVGGFR
jgi:hypothetical protein